MRSHKFRLGRKEPLGVWTPQQRLERNNGLVSIVWLCGWMHRPAAKGG